MLTAIILALLVGVAIGFVFGNQRLNSFGPMEAVNSNDATGASDGTTVGGAKLLPGQNVIDNAASAPNLTNAVAAYKATGLADTLAGEGPFTVFIPTNDAFAAHPEGIEGLLNPEYKSELNIIANYCVFPGVYTSAELRSMATAGQSLISISNQAILPKLVGGTLKLTDAAGTLVTIESTDVVSSNGIIHTVQATFSGAGDSHSH